MIINVSGLGPEAQKWPWHQNKYLKKIIIIAQKSTEWHDKI